MDINGSELLIIAILAVVLVGPERLPEYVRGLRSIVKRLRGIMRDGQAALKNEFGEDVDWQTLDPRQYDPRRIVRDALFEEDATPRTGTAAVAAATAGASVSAVTGGRKARREGVSRAPEQPDHSAEIDGVPFDPEAT